MMLDHMINHLIIIMDVIVEQKHGKMLMARGESIGNVINLSIKHIDKIQESLLKFGTKTKKPDSDYFIGSVIFNTSYLLHYKLVYKGNLQDQME